MVSGVDISNQQIKTFGGLLVVPPITRRNPSMFMNIYCVLESLKPKTESNSPMASILGQEGNYSMLQSSCAEGFKIHPQQSTAGTMSSEPPWGQPPRVNQTISGKKPAVV